MATTTEWPLARRTGLAAGGGSTPDVLNYRFNNAGISVGGFTTKSCVRRGRSIVESASFPKGFATIWSGAPRPSWIPAFWQDVVNLPSGTG